MSEVNVATPADVNIAVTSDERQFLLRFLEQSLPAKRVEVHRTDSIVYRQELERDVKTIESLVAKLRR
jgi:hypothetical protein